MSIDGRIRKLETRAATRADAPTLAEAAAAYERVVLHVRGNFIARLTKAPLSPESPEYARDRETLRRYRAANGAVMLEPNARQRLKALLGRMAERRAADLARRERNAQRTGSADRE